MELDNGTNLVADIKNCDRVLPKNVIENLKNIILDNVYDEEKIKVSINDDANNEHGLSFYDIFVIQCFIKLLFSKLNKKINIVELGCGSSTRLFSNDIHVKELFTYSLEDMMNNKTVNNNIKFIKCDILENKDIILQNCLTADLLFIDCNHSYNFAKFYCEHILRHIKIPIIIHDFLPVTENKYFKKTWGEQYYLLHEFLSKQYYKLYAYTALSDEEVILLNDENLVYNRTKRMIPCIALLLENKHE